MIDLKAIREKAESWLNQDYHHSVDFSPRQLLSLIRIIELQSEALKDIGYRYEGDSRSFIVEHIKTVAKQALEQVSKILTKQNEGG